VERRVSANPFELTVEGLAENLAVASFRGRERVSAGYRFDVTVLREGTGDLGASLDRPARLVLFEAGVPARCVHGIVGRAVELGALGKGQRGARIRIVPRAERLRLRRRRRILQDATTLDIAARLFAEHGVASLSLVRRPAPVRPYTVQYDETDWDFVARLFAEEGYSFFFDHPLEGAEERLTIFDSAMDQAPIHGDPHLQFDRHAEGSALALRGDHVTELVVADRLRPSSALVRGWDFERPNAPPESRAGDITRGLLSSGRQGTRIVVEHEGSYESDVGPRPAATRLEQARRRARVASGRSLCRRLAPGRSFVLHGHDVASLDRAWAVVALTQEGRAPAAGDERHPVWESRFEAIDAATTPRPRWRGARPRQSAETAVVVGPAGHELYTDKHGRVKVQFHWDDDGANDERSSCFLRVSHAWAGAGWGTQMIPRIGMEVVVTFLGGDLDRPLVTGCVVNATHPHPFSLPSHFTRSGLRSRTFGGTGYNEISIDDALGKEEIYVRAERDFLQDTENNYTSHVRGARLLTVDGGAVERIKGSEEIHVEGGRRIDVDGEDDLHVTRAVRRTFDLDERTEIAGGSSTSILGTQKLDVRGGRAVTVGTEKAPETSSHIVYGTASTQATGAVTLQSDEAITLRCGESYVEILKDKIVLYSPTLELRATKQMTARSKDGPTMTLGDDVEILSKKLRVFTEGAALELDKDAKIDGGQIKLGYDPSKPEKKDDSKEPETKKLQVKLTDYHLEPYANRHYHVLAEGVRIEGDTDGDGFVRADVPKSATQVTIRLWTEEYPDGDQATYVLRLKDDIPPASSILGAKLRLTNLGYYQGPRDGTPSAELRAAILEFQSDHEDSHGLDPTGEYDEGTQGALVEVHGS
jgi:type VI secretion system secreted protein VgrG